MARVRGKVPGVTELIIDHWSLKLARSTSHPMSGEEVIHNRSNEGTRHCFIRNHPAVDDRTDKLSHRAVNVGTGVELSRCDASPQYTSKNRRGLLHQDHLHAPERWIPLGPVNQGGEDRSKVSIHELIPEDIELIDQVFPKVPAWFDVSCHCLVSYRIVQQGRRIRPVAVQSRPTETRSFGHPQVCHRLPPLRGEDLSSCLEGGYSRALLSRIQLRRLPSRQLLTPWLQALPRIQLIGILTTFEGSLALRGRCLGRYIRRD